MTPPLCQRVRTRMNEAELTNEYMFSNVRKNERVITSKSSRRVNMSIERLYYLMWDTFPQTPLSLISFERL